MGWLAHGEVAKAEAARVVMLPDCPSKLSVAAVRKLLRAGITYENLRVEINTLPLIRVGPGYTLFPLRDGYVCVSHRNRSATEIVRNWKLETKKEPSAEAVGVTNR